ncbi:hypothetical protein PRCB_17560 [Pantoea rodasii]|uniref:Uncharacterized protein n=1 Tax=Pantoea rodasii TaxID=1076549 RepID=A0A2M9W967_9GAMM|nr:hypothetical protein [Pantoea rodasii]ORM63969.1 hypothetical protein HA45_12700 [Pantoea rodasii]PJZ04087.1 hypothetical protein PRCB_17560 [Pantoea rodasii]
MQQEEFREAIKKWSSLNFTAIIIDDTDDRNEIYLATSDSPPNSRLYLCDARDSEQAKAMGERFSYWLKSYKNKI